MAPKLFPHGHATHPQWRMAAALVLAQLRGQLALPAYADAPPLGLLYLTDAHAGHAQDILDHFSAELPLTTDWVGTVGVGVCASNAEYIDEPALAVMLCDVPPDQFRVFSGVAPLASQAASGFVPNTALVHADAQMPDLPDLLVELAERTAAGYLFGGLAASRGPAVQFAAGGNGNVAGQGGARGVFQGGLSGVAFGPGVALLSRVTQGCRPVGATHTVTEVEGNVVIGLGGEPALDVLLRDLHLGIDAVPAPDMRAALATVRTTLVGLSDASAGAPGPAGRADAFGTDVRVRHIIGLDPSRRAVAIAERVDVGSRLAFSQRDVHAARADLVRICAEIREALEPETLPLEVATALAGTDADAQPHPARRIAGAVYVSCAGRGGPHFGAPGAELQIVRHALGDVPLVGFFAGGEIARQQVYGYTGVLTVFTN